MNISIKDQLAILQTMEMIIRSSEETENQLKSFRRHLEQSIPIGLKHRLQTIIAQDERNQTDLEQLKQQVKSLSVKLYEELEPLHGM